MVCLQLQWLDGLHHHPSGERYPVSCIWARIFTDRTLTPLDLWKDDLCASRNISENRCLCARARHWCKVCLQGRSWCLQRWQDGGAFPCRLGAPVRSRDLTVV